MKVLQTRTLDLAPPGRLPSISTTSTSILFLSLSIYTPKAFSAYSWTGLAPAAVLLPHLLRDHQTPPTAPPTAPPARRRALLPLTSSSASSATVHQLPQRYQDHMSAVTAPTERICGRCLRSASFGFPLKTRCCCHSVSTPHPLPGWIPVPWMARTTSSVMPASPPLNNGIHQKPSMLSMSPSTRVTLPPFKV